MIIVIGHATKIGDQVFEPPVNTVTELFDNDNIEYIHIRHHFSREKNSEVIVGQNKSFLSIPKLNNIVRYIFQIFKTVLFLNKTKNIEIVIAINPLNALSVIIFNSLFFRNIKYIYYSADYSTSRFGMKILDKIYIYIDKLSSKKALVTLSVSSRIVALRKKYGLSDDKNIFLPNVPEFPVLSETNKLSDKITLITLAKLDEQIDYAIIFEAINVLKNKYNIYFNIAGSGPSESKIKKLAEDMGLSDRVKFLGFLQHSDALKEIQISDIGLALYNGKWSFNYYGDSMKCREYFNFALPVVTTDTHSTVEEIEEYDAGVIVELTKESMVEGLEKIIKNYEEYSKNSLSLGKEYAGIHRKIILPLVKIKK